MIGRKNEIKELNRLACYIPFGGGKRGEGSLRYESEIRAEGKI